MVVFPNAKINIGLNITGKRADGYHNIESFFYPLPLCDILEVLKDDSFGKIKFYTSGISIPGDHESNLCLKAYDLLNAALGPLPSVSCYLHKIIPIGAGLGGGSSDGAFFIKLINDLLNLSLPPEDLIKFAGKLGSDCSFFLQTKPCYVSGTGNIMEPVSLDISDYNLVLVFPEVHVSTQDAYGRLNNFTQENLLKNAVLDYPVDQWQEKVFNGFEDVVFEEHPILKSIKEKLGDLGASYVSMSGSGSSIYGLFKDKIPLLKNIFPGLAVWQINLKRNELF